MTLAEQLAQDCRYAFRGLKASRAFTVAAILTLALGIGANTAVFSVVRGVLLTPLPFLAPHEIVRVWHARPSTSSTQAALSEPDFLDWQRESRRAASMGAYFFASGLSGLDFTGAGNPERLSAALVTDGFFQTLGTAPIAGRVLSATDHLSGRNRVVVISHGMWMRRFGADRGILGRTVTLNNQLFEVVGVMPSGFTYPDPRSIDAWIPLSFFGPESIGRSRGTRFLQVVARLAPGTTESQLTAELGAIATRLTTEYPDNPGWTAATTRSIRETIVGEVRRPLLVLMTAVGMLLLITCANVASLLLARGSAREREFAVRAALGAERARIVRQILTESVILALGGAVAGVALGVAGARGLAAAGTSQLPRASEIGVDYIVLAFSLGLALISALLFGVVPALRASVSNLTGMLRAGARGSVGGAGQRFRNGLVIAEVAIAVVLVVGAGLATKSFSRLLDVETGWRSDNALVVVMTVSDRFPARSARLAYYDQVLNTIRSVPGVLAAGAVRDLPLRGNGEQARTSTPEQSAPGTEHTSQVHHVSTDYFKAIGAPLLAGRSFLPADAADTPPVVVVNEELGRRLWPGERPEGRTIRMGGTDATVIGVVGNMRQRGIAEPADPALYVHAQQNFRSRMSIVVRTVSEPSNFAPRVRQAIWSLDPSQTITEVTTLEAVLGDTVSRPRLLAWLLSLFGLLGLTLGALGLFGVLTYAVTQRRQEIGVRIALGASSASVLRLIVGHGMALAGAGVLTGVAFAALLTRSMKSVLYGVAPHDPVTFVQVTVVLLLAGLAACWIPARRAIGTDPIAALRSE